ncbi:MAG TPA: hypothetical protein PLD47_03145 [Aggregatilineales bacterium]|nr:hypothetical protein [Anaerolineales bacterium]HRE46696.1 hypothetical protein [Aggregatilineales bacterium]
MKRLSAFLAALLIVLSAALGGGIALARRNTLAQPIFTAPNGAVCARFCLFGIQFDSSFLQAVQLVERHPAARQTVQEIAGERMVVFAGERIVIYIGNAGELITTVFLVQPYPMYDVLRDWGAPDAVHTEVRDPASVWLLYDSRRSYIHLKLTDRDRLSPFDPVVKIAMSRSGFLFSPPVMRWRGFTAMRAYRALTE